MSALPQSPTFVPATYRVLTFGDAKFGPYAVVRRAGGSTPSSSPRA